MKDRTVLFNTTCPSNLLIKVYTFYTQILVQISLDSHSKHYHWRKDNSKQQTPFRKITNLSSHLSPLKYFLKIFIIWLQAYKLIIFIWWHGLYGFYFGQQNCRVLRALFLRFFLFLFWSCTLVWSFHKIVKKNYFLLQKNSDSVALASKDEVENIITFYNLV